MHIRSALISGLVMASLLHGSAGTPTGSSESSRPDRSPPEAPLALPANFLPIMNWDGLRAGTAVYDDRHAGIASLAECGFNTIGFVRPEHLKQCEQLGLRAILRPEGHPIRWKELSDDQIDRVVRTMVDESRASEAVIGYFLMDEPGVTFFPALAKAVAAVKRHAPGRLAYINLYPNYATLGAANLSQLGTDNYTEYLERFVREVQPQFISYDNYRILFSDDMRKPPVAQSYFTNLLEVRRVAQKHGLPFWNICSSNQIRPVTPPPSPANLQLQAYTTLAAGAGNVTWFTYYSRSYGYAPIDKEGRRTSTWSYLQLVNRQVAALGPILRRLKSTGVCFTSPAPAPALPVLPGRAISAIDSPTPLMLGEFEDDEGRPWAMIVNLSLERSAKLTITARNREATLHCISPADGSEQPLAPNHTLWLTAGAGALILIAVR